MKKLMLLASTLVAGVALASTVSSEQTFGVLKITSSLKQTVVSVPWVAAGTGSAIMVKDFVKTTNLHEGTLLYKYENGVFKAWILSEGAWTGISAVSSFGGKTASPGTTETLTQQDALIIVRPDGYTSGDIYLYGQYSNASALEYAITRSNGVALVSPVNTSGSAINLNSEVTWNNENPPKNGDLIKLHTAGGSAPTYSYDNTRADGKYWARKVNGKLEEAVVQPGMGFWYTPVDNSGTTKFTVNQ